MTRSSASVSVSDGLRGILLLCLIRRPIGRKVTNYLVVEAGGESPKLGLAAESSERRNPRCFLLPFRILRRKGINTLLVMGCGEIEKIAVNSLVLAEICITWAESDDVESASENSAVTYRVCDFPQNHQPEF